MKIKRLIQEALETPVEDRKLIISNMVNFAKKFLNIKDTKVKIIITFERTPELTTTAYYIPKQHIIKVYAKDRLLCDIARSLFHELVHCKQDIENRLSDIKSDGSDGSPIENEANSKAGEMIRIYGKLTPSIYTKKL